MKKIAVTIFLVIIMLLLPISTATISAKNYDLQINSTGEENNPELFITKSQYSNLGTFIENTFEGDIKQEATDIVENVTSYDSEEKHYKVIMNNLIAAVEEHSYYKIITESEFADVDSKSELNQLLDNKWNFSARPLGQLINELINIIKNRLGWLYELFYQGGTLFVEGVSLAKEFINRFQDVNIAILFASAVNLVVYIPIEYFTESVKDLFNLDLDSFLLRMQELTGTFTSDLYVITQNLESILSLFGDLFQSFRDYLSEIIDFLGWIDSEDPWEEQITVKGTAKNLFGQPIAGATVTCRGVETTTDSNGYYEFKVNTSESSNDSIPSNSLYGLHNCTITISKDGETLKKTPVRLSYVVSGGEIYWPFFITKLDEVILEIILILVEKINILLERYGFSPIIIYT